MGLLRPNRQRANIAIAMIWVVMGLEILSLISGYMQYDLLQGVVRGGDLSTEAANANDLREQVVNIILVVAWIVSIVTFIQWFRRAYYNLHQKIDGLAYSEGWAAGGWFVPILNLFRPYQIMKEMYVETKHYLLNRGFLVIDNFTTAALGWWWALWIISRIFKQVTTRYTMHADVLDQLVTSTVLGMIGNLITIPLAILAVKVIKDYAAVEPMLDEIEFENETDLFPTAIASEQSSLA